jgi:pyridinium-3,5-bisthiocarboxylic acid mononucleotide nickel chelatase
MVKCAHGLFPVPAPATMEVLSGIPVKTGLVPFEATTPTGAAIMAVVVDEFVSRNQFIAEKTAYGIGHKDSEVPNVLRVLQLKEKQSEFNTEESCMLECNIDDMNPEIYDYLFENIFKLGADDVFIIPISMKKSRPATILSVLCNQQIEQNIITFLLKETSSLGVRSHRVTKHMLDREIISVDTSFGKVRVKKSWFGTEIFKFKPEYDDCARIAKENGIPLIHVFSQLQSELNELK